MVVSVTSVNVLGRLVSAPSKRQSSYWRLTGFILSVIGPGLVAAAALPFRARIGLAGFLLFTLVVVLVVALLSGVVAALVSVISGFAFASFFFIAPYDSLQIYLRLNDIPLLAYLLVGAVLSLLVDALTELALEQRNLRRQEAALRRVATLAASGATTAELLSTATDELRLQLGAGSVTVIRQTQHGDGAVLASSGSAADAAPARVSTEIMIDGQRWARLSAAGRVDSFPADAQARTERFGELLGTAVAAAEARAELAASRARVVAAADDARRRIERDLHDGAQQRMVALALQLRTAQMRMPDELSDLSGELAAIAEGLADATNGLREMARGIHPSILAEGGIAPALRTLARRSAVPVELELETAARLDAAVEVATYYVVSESLTNIAKHANASQAWVSARLVDAELRIEVRDDGVGGASTAAGTGIIGLVDRVAALGGTLHVVSEAGAGTTVTVSLPAGSP